MSLLFNEFKGDLEHLRKLLVLTENVKLFTSSSFAPNAAIANDNFINKGLQIQTLGREANIGLTFVPGTLVLYLAGRFEYFVRSIFEDLAAGIADKCLKFDNLPKDFKENLFSFTADVMKNPRKYGHAENGRNSFINTLSDNIKGLNITSVNIKCISITTENMRPTILAELFARIGAKEVWTKVGQHPKMQIFFETSDTGLATNEAKKQLDQFMDLRNTIAHPSVSFSWPDMTTIISHINFIENLSLALDEVSGIYLLSLGKIPTTVVN
ncbi:HEPN domain-containing protein [Mucilaginibacter sp. KACC 22773]|uniref:HEPN domain-containing protein n=1 Tax=Mucilaginibacter sp. KACC 22773 TaxID=3025671 RepID=UPI002366D472|nr:HEPN domain-containing protein [Mucilaginibacter sp. KACC 22773]WDF75787.1 HEPN domain-containing protein [Mucilaginibacter sp. KACC 22773]